MARPPTPSERHDIAFEQNADSTLEEAVQDEELPAAEKDLAFKLVNEGYAGTVREIYDTFRLTGDRLAETLAFTRENGFSPVPFALLLTGRDYSFAEAAQVYRALQNGSKSIDIEAVNHVLDYDKNHGFDVTEIPSSWGHTERLALLDTRRSGASLREILPGLRRDASFGNAMNNLLYGGGGRKISASSSGSLSRGDTSIGDKTLEHDYAATRADQG